MPNFELTTDTERLNLRSLVANGGCCRASYNSLETRIKGCPMDSLPKVTSSVPLLGMTVQ